jgi:hypothetical protein
MTCKYLIFPYTCFSYICLHEHLHSTILRWFCIKYLHIIKLTLSQSYPYMTLNQWLVHTFEFTCWYVPLICVMHILYMVVSWWILLCIVAMIIMYCVWSISRFCRKKWLVNIKYLDTVFSDTIAPTICASLLVRARICGCGCIIRGCLCFAFCVLFILSFSYAHCM